MTRSDAGIDQSRARVRHLGRAALAPFDRTHRVDLASGWLPGWAESTAVIVPLTRDRAIVIGRHGGPAFLDSEIARLNHLAALIK